MKALYEKSVIVQKADKAFKVVGVSNSKGYLYNKEGLGLQKLLSIKQMSDYSKGYHAGGLPSFKSQF